MCLFSAIIKPQGTFLRIYNKLSLHHLKLSTIFALSSGQGKCGVAVIRISGPDTSSALKLVTQTQQMPKPRQAVLKYIKNPVSGELLDRGLIIWFPAPRSFTGEDCCELQIHGGVAVVSAVLNALKSVNNLRLAEPGEFTRRAFYNGKLDLTEVEGLADLLSAETDIQRKQAFLQTQGSLGKVYSKWRAKLLSCLAHLEAHIEFGETEIMDPNFLIQVREEITGLRRDIQQHLDDGRKGERLRNGIKTVILGEPNVGKSSLLNILCQRPAAIVTPLEGTTRDILEVTLDINGYPMVLADTAGLRSKTTDIVEQEGINRALESYKTADLIILVIDSTKCVYWRKANPNNKVVDYLKFYVQQLNLIDLLNTNEADSYGIFNKQCLVILNKLDLCDYVDPSFVHHMQENGVILVSCKTEDGFSLLLEELTKKLELLCGQPSEEHPSMNQLRHRQHLMECVKYLDRSLDHLVLSGIDVLLADGFEVADVVTDLLVENLRKAVRHIGKLTGVVTTEQLLDIIFRDFCIGK